MLLIKNCNLINMKNIYEEKYDILIEGSVIKQIDHDINMSDEDVTIINAEGRFVTPGIVDPHCHIGVKELVYRHAGDDMDEKTDPVQPHLRAIDGIKADDEAFEIARNAGVTTVVAGPGDANVIGGTFAALKTYGRTVDDMTIVEEVAMKVALGVVPKETYASKNKAPGTRMGVAAVLRENLEKARLYHEQYKLYEENKESSQDMVPPKFDMKLHALMRVFDGMLVKIRAIKSDDMMTGVRIAEEFGLNYSIDKSGEAWRIPSQLKKHQVNLVVGPTFGGKRVYEYQHRDVGVGKHLEAVDMNFAVSTGHPDIDIGNAMAHLILMYRKGLSRKSALESVTINAAKAVGLDNRLGSIEEGKDADIVIWSGDPLDYYTFADVVIINGEVVRNR